MLFQQAEDFSKINAPLAQLCFLPPSTSKVANRITGMHMNNLGSKQTAKLAWGKPVDHQLTGIQVDTK